MYLPSNLCNSSTHLNGRSPPTGDVAVLQLLRPPSSLSLFFLRSGVGTYPLWLLLLGRYWLKGRAVRGSLTDVRRADMSSLRTSGIFLWGAPSDSESLPRPVGRGTRQEGGVRCVMVQVRGWIWTVTKQRSHRHETQCSDSSNGKFVILDLIQQFWQRLHSYFGVLLPLWCSTTASTGVYKRGNDLGLLWKIPQRKRHLTSEDKETEQITAHHHLNILLRCCLM